jgi:hypothetical protein
VGPRLEIVGSSRLVGGYHSPLLGFGVFSSAPEILGTEVDDAWDYS